MNKKQQKSIRYLLLFTAGLFIGSLIYLVIFLPLNLPLMIFANSSTFKEKLYKEIPAGSAISFTEERIIQLFPKSRMHFVRNAIVHNRITRTQEFVHGRLYVTAGRYGQNPLNLYLVATELQLEIDFNENGELTEIRHFQQPIGL